jgi:ribonucleoside-diphosphate reductase alpha chain
MGQKGKILITEDGRFDLERYIWDDQVLSDRLIKAHAIDIDQAMDVIKALKQTVAESSSATITVSMIDQMIMDKLKEYGLTEPATINMDGSFLKKDGLSLSRNARTVLERRYLKKDNKGKVIERPQDMFRRVARHIAKAEKKYGDAADAAKMEKIFYDMMTEFRFLPNSPTLMNAGRELGQLAACFVLPVKDSMDGIFESLKNAAVIHKSGGGTGFSFSRLRPKDSMVGTTGGIASGPVSFMKIFNTATEQVKQGGTRRGANMAILRVDHPDIMEFIYCKQSNGDLNNFNISVGITDAFVDAVKQERNYDLLDPRDKSKVGEANAGEVYQALVYQAWQNGDPGIIFLDRLNRDNPTPEIGEIESTNPCGEQPLLPMEACNLGSVNLAKYVTHDESGPRIDYDGLKELVWCAVRFLDNTIDMSQYPLPEIDEMVKGNRKIGLGVMGFADMLYQLNIAYNSKEALETAEDVMGFIQKESHEASKELATERGVFTNFGKSVFKNREGCGYRNATTTTIAPTGTLSILANCSSGVEPLFALSFVRTVMENDKLMEVNPHFERVARERNFYNEDLMDKIARHGSIHKLNEIPGDVRDVYVTAHDVSPEWHVRMQAAFQKYTDNAVSKTVNLPMDATVDDVRSIYNLANELGCKGVTIYRDGSKENQVLSFGDKSKAKGSPFPGPMERPETLEGFTTRIKTGYGHLYVTVTEQSGQPFEVFATIGKSGRSTTAKTEAIGRLVSLALRSGVKVDEIVEQLKGIGGEHPVFQDGGLVLSIPDAIARVLDKRYQKEDDSENGTYRNSLMGEKCPACSQTISFEEGCMTCHFCGFSKCG